MVQTNIPVLAPEILAAFANSQIFNDHPSSKMTSPVSSLSPAESVHRFRTKAAFKEEQYKKELDNKSDIQPGVKGDNENIFKSFNSKYFICFILKESISKMYYV